MMIEVRRRGEMNEMTREEDEFETQRTRRFTEFVIESSLCSSVISVF